ncbi:MAG: glycosyltransferase [Steroidobacteraceae bacterium]
MVIAHVITRLLRAGSEENTISSCLSQARAGHEVLLIHGEEWSADQAARCHPHIKVIELREMVHAVNVRKDIRATQTMAALFRQTRPTIVHTHQSKAGIIGRIAARLAHVPVVVHGVHIVPFASVGALQKLTYLAAERAVAGYTDAYINVSEGTRQTYIDNSIGRPEQHFVAHSGFDVRSFQTATPPDDWRQMCGVDSVAQKPPVILMLAALEERKRHMAFIEAFTRIKTRIPDAKLVLAGEGPMRKEITATIARLGLESSVKLLGFHPQPERLIALADVTVLTSLREGLPRVVVQSLAGGKPVVTTRLPGIEDLVAHDVNGLVMPEDDFHATADAIAELLLSEERLQRMQHYARQTDVSSWDVESMCQTLTEIYGRFVPDGPVQNANETVALERASRPHRVSA